MAPKPKTASTRKATAAPVSQLESHLGFWLRFVSNHVSSEFKRLVESNGVSVSEWVALRQLYSAGEATATELMDALGMTKGAVSKIITRLQGKGLVTRAAVDADRRAQQIVLSVAGRKLVPRLARLADENDEAFFGHMEPALRAQLTTVLQDIVRTHQLKQLPVE